MSESQKLALLDRVKTLDWEFDRYFKDGQPNPNWSGYCSMNLFAVKHDGSTDSFQDFRVIEKKSNDAFHAFEKVDPPPENYDWEIA